MGWMTAQQSGFGDINSTAANSLAWARAGVVGSSAAPVLAGFGQMQQQDYLAGVARNNAAIANTNAQTAQQSGTYVAGMREMQAGQTVGREAAQQGANGLDVNVGSTKAVRATTRNVGALDAAMDEFNASRQAYADKVQSATLTTQAKLDQMSGQNALLAGASKGLSSYITGTASIGSKLAQYQQYGVSG